MCAASGSCGGGDGAEPEGAEAARVALALDMKLCDAEAGVVGAAVSGGRARRACGWWCGYCSQVALSALAVGSLALFLFLFNEYLKAILFWVNAQSPAVVLALFMALFTLVSFPVAIGYLLLIISCGYLLGLPRGLLVVVLSANTGVAVAHASLRALRPVLPLQRLLRHDAARALLKVISGPQAIKIVFFARLTPVPFGLQNTIFAVSEVGGVGYHVASFAGLLPAQLINVYLGSTLRSIQDVLHESHVTGYVVFVCQILIGVSLMVWVVQRARRELTLALLEAELGREGSVSGSSASLSLS